MKKTEKQNTGKLKIIPLGGLEQIGMNITAFEYEDSIIVVDCGLAFPDDEMLGIDLVIPDITYLKENASKVKGLVITHGHEDHIGAIPYALKELNMPIYATKLTMGLIENKLKEHNLLRTTRRKVIKHGQSINLGRFRIEFIKTNHSISDAAALAIYTPAGIIVHTGDFKIDYTPVFGDAIDLGRFAELGKKGVLALMCESTNVEREGYTPSERTVGRTLRHLFDENKDHRIIVGRSYLFAEFLEFICNKLYLGSNDDLYGGLAWTHHASHTGGLDQLFIDLGIILDLKTESGNAVINRSHILRTANAFQNDLRYFREVVIGQSYLGLICIVILTSRSLQIKLGKEKMHPYIAAHSRHDWCTYCSLFYWRKLAGWRLVLHT